MGEPHEDPMFANAVTYAVTVTVTVAGGARPATARRRAERVAARLANTAARAADVLDAQAVTGPIGTDGEMIMPEVVRFSQANTGHGTYRTPELLARYLDPDYERALASRAAADARYRQARQNDRQRRLAVDCRNAYREAWSPASRSCECVYCDPALHLAIAQHPEEVWGEPPRCLCGTVVTAAGRRCDQHDDVVLVVLDRDPAALQELARLLAGTCERGGAVDGLGGER